MDKKTKKCRKCLREKSVNEFYKRSKGSKDGLGSYCNSCQYENTSAIKNRYRASGKCVNCGVFKPNNHKYCDNCKIKTNGYERKYQKQAKDLVFDYYGSNCVCCGESNVRFLTIDHINDDGAEHRRAIGSNIYKTIVKAKFPNKYRILCHNCNSGRFFNGGLCPGSVDQGHHGAWKNKEITLWNLLKTVQGNSDTALVK